MILEGLVRKIGWICKSIFKLFFISLIIVTIIACSGRESENPDYKFKTIYESNIYSILNKMTLDEKIGMLHGVGKFVSGGVVRLGIPPMHYTDGPTGIREELARDSWEPLGLTTDSVTFFPTGTALAATWNRQLAKRYGKGLGLEARARGKDVLLGPAVNIIRTPIIGRTFEYFTEDPYLNSEIAVNYVRGLQNQDVAACVKHYTANNQERNRGSVNVVMDERTLREIYLPAFKSAVKKADAMAIMGAYNKFRGEYLCHNDYLNNRVLKHNFGFQGIVVSDWGAVHNTIKAAKGGLDVEMGSGQPYRENYMADPLKKLVKEGEVSDSLINDKVRRILRVMYNLEKIDSTNREKGEKTTKLTKDIAYDVASESIALLKNKGSLLPLRKNELESIAIIGENAHQTHASGGFGAGVKAEYEITPYQGLKNKVGDQIQLKFAQGYVTKFFKHQEFNRDYPVHRANDSLIGAAVEVARNSDVALIMAGTNREVETEGKDRLTIDLPFGQDSLIKAVSEVNPRTIVVIVAGAPFEIKTANQYAPSILYAWFNGSEAGNALADVIFGDINPSGKLPFTIPEKLNDVGAHALDAYPGENLEVQYKEGILVGYRWFDTKAIKPLYPFGYGLSYTDFQYSELKSDKDRYTMDENIILTMRLKNIGTRAGKEVIQCYASNESSEVLQPAKELIDFKKIDLKPNREKQVRFTINPEKLAYFSNELKRWIVEPGKFTFLIGASSRDIQAKTKVSLVK